MDAKLAAKQAAMKRRWAYGQPRKPRKARRRCACGCGVLASRGHLFVKGHSPLNSSSPEYRSFNAAKQRCRDPKHKTWKDYGGRGVKFLFTSYAQWLAELGPKPTLKHTVDRMDSAGHYAPGNVRWATASEQQRNKRKPPQAARQIQTTVEQSHTPQPATA